MTEEQKANVDKALQETQLSKQIGGATDASNRPQPNEPTPIEKSAEIGKNLHDQGVRLDPDK